jgi:hypothetical protein
VGGQSRLVDVWGTGHCGQQVVGESHYFDALRSVVATRDRRATGEMMVQAVLVPEPANRHDPNAVAVTIEGRLVGYLPREDAPAYATVLGPLASRGLFARLAARLWWEGVRDGDWLASVSLDLAPADVLLPVNSIPLGGVEIPQGGAMQVAGEDAHLDVLTPLLGTRQRVAAYASLHEITERRPRSERQVLEVRIDGRRVGQLTPAMSEHLLALIRHADGLGLALYVRGHVRGNALKAELTIYPTRAADLPQQWIAELQSRTARPAEVVSATPRDGVAIESSSISAQPSLPPPGWYRDPTGPGLRWWDGSVWTLQTTAVQ